MSKSASVIEEIAASARRHPERPAVVARDRELSYGELAMWAARIRAGLPRAGEGARLGILTGDDAATYAGILAILASGAAYVPLNRKNPPERNRRIAGDAGVSAILASGEPGAALPADVGAPVIPIDGLIETGTDGEGDGFAPAPLGGDALAYILFTSGSTGRPKGVPISHGNLSALFRAADEAGHAMQPQDRVLQMCELTFDLSVYPLFGALRGGAALVVVPERGIGYMNIATALQAQAVTVAVMVPSVLGYLERFFDELSLPALRLSLFCGEALPLALAERWRGCAPQAEIVNTYGPTEATVFCTDYRLPRREALALNGTVAIGRPFTGVSTAIVPPGAETAGPADAGGAQGELCIAGPQVMAGYWGDAEKTAAAFLEIGGERYYRTGDLVERDASGELLYRGRMDSQVKVDGHRVELGEIEHHARTQLGDGLVAAVCAPDDAGAARIALFVSAAAVDRQALEGHLKARMPHYMQPKEIVVLDEMPVNLNGKIDRPALAARLRDGGARD